MRRILLAAVATCLVTVAVTLVFRASMFLSMLRNVHVGNTGLGVIVHKCRSYSSCISHAASTRTQNADDLSRGLVAGKIIHSRNNVSVMNIIPLGKLPAKDDGSLKYKNYHYSQSTNVHKMLFHSRELVIWSTDHHPAPAYDARHLLEPLGVRFLQNDLSPYCSFFNLCAERHNLKVSCVVINFLLIIL